MRIRRPNYGSRCIVMCHCTSRDMVTYREITCAEWLLYFLTSTEALARSIYCSQLGTEWRALKNTNEEDPV